MPLAYHEEGLDTEVLAAFGIDRRAGARPRRAGTTSPSASASPEGEVTIAIVGKYTGLKDAYKSLIEALHHGGIANKVKVNLDWIESEIFEKRGPGAVSRRRPRHPGAGRLRRARLGRQDPARPRFARERKMPYFGICFGMQMAVIEAARNLAGIEKANSTEFGPTPEPVVGLMTEWVKGNELERRAADGDLGGTMRLGAYPARLRQGSQGRARSTATTDDLPSATATATRSTSTTATGSRSSGMVVLRPVAGRRPARDRRIRGPPLVHRRPVPPGAEEPPVRRRTRCSRSFIGAAVEQSRLV